MNEILECSGCHQIGHRARGSECPLCKSVECQVPKKALPNYAKPPKIQLKKKKPSE